jgi:hypothetical protein
MPKMYDSHSFLILTKKKKKKGENPTQLKNKIVKNKSFTLFLLKIKEDSLNKLIDSQSGPFLSVW